MMTETAAARLLKTAPTRADDSVVLDYDSRLLRRKMLTTIKGRDFLVSLPNVTNLDDFWGFSLPDGTTIRVDAAPEQVLVITGDLTRLAWHIGNRHTPCQIMADRLMIREDHVLERMITGLGGAITRAHLPFKPEGGAYGHGRTMGHSHGSEAGPEARSEAVSEETFGWHHHGDGQMHFHAPKPAKTGL
jgi:urease accessory protein